MNEFLKLVDKYLDIPELDDAILNELVSRIVVHSPVRENGRKQDAIELASSIVGDMYNTNGNFDIRAFLNFYEDTFSGKEVL